MEGHGHIGDLPPSHARGQEMLPSMEEGVKDHELLGRNGNGEAVAIDALRVIKQTVAFNGSINLGVFGGNHLSTHAVDFHGKVAKLNIVVVPDVLHLTPVVTARQGAQYAADFVEVIETHIEVDVAKLSQIGVGIKHSQAETFEQHRLNVVLAQRGQGGSQNLFQPHLAEQIIAHGGPHHAEHGIGGTAVARHLRSHTAYQGLVAMVLCRLHHRVPIDGAVDGDRLIPQGGTKQCKILCFGLGHTPY